MAEDEEGLDRDIQKKIAVGCFNMVWTLMDKKDRSQEETGKMIHAAHASRFHWGEIGTAVERERGEWQISRMYTVIGRPEPALYHAKRCLEICQQNNIGDWDIAFAYEAMARAYATAGEKALRDEYLELATEAGEKIKDQADKDLVLGDLKTIPR